MINFMRIYTFPGSNTFYKQLCWISNKAINKDPMCLHHTNLHMKVVDLDNLENSPASYSLRSSAGIAGLKDPVVLFSQSDQKIIATFIMAFKKNGIWPMLAVITEESQYMSLAELFEHLSDDRKLENQRRKALQNVSES